MPTKKKTQKNRGLRGEAGLKSFTGTKLWAGVVNFATLQFQTIIQLISKKNNAG